MKLTIYKSNSSNGRYVIHLSNTKSEYFWKKKDAEVFLLNYKFVKHLDMIISKNITL